MVQQTNPIYWGNMSIYPLQKPQNTSLWVFDDRLLVGKEEIAVFSTLGQMRANLTVSLWEKLGLTKQYTCGWFVGRKIPLTEHLPFSASACLQTCIVARTVYPEIIQCTIDGNCSCIKQSAFMLGSGPMNPDCCGAENLQETRYRSEEIAMRLKVLCYEKDVIGLDGIRISWGITVENKTLTPVGGLGTPDCTRYFLKAKGVDHHLDRRSLKTLPADFCASYPLQIRSHYETSHALLTQ